MAVDGVTLGMPRGSVTALLGGHGAAKRALPPAHEFEGLRALVLHGEFRADVMMIALAENGAYLALDLLVFHYFLASARRNGSLVQMGE